MLIQFSFANYRSFRKETCLSLQAGNVRENPGALIDSPSGKLLASVAVFGANAAGKSNLTGAAETAVNVIRTSASRQSDEEIPGIERFLFENDGNEDTSFEFDFITEGRRYIYGFSCNRKRVSEEHLSVYKSQKPSLVFSREGEQYRFTDGARERELGSLAEKNTPNKLFLSTATLWNAESTRDAYLFFTKGMEITGVSSAASVLALYDSDKDGSLRTFTRRLMNEADINIRDYTIESYRIDSERLYRINAVHRIGDRDYSLPLQDESKGTWNLFTLAPVIKRTLESGGVLFVDDLDNSLHPALVLYIVSLFNSSETNPNRAQLILTSHTTELLSLSYMRRDQIYFVDKDNDSGVSELYSLDDFPVRTREDVRKAYLCGRFGAVPKTGLKR